MGEIECERPVAIGSRRTCLRRNRHSGLCFWRVRELEWWFVCENGLRSHSRASFVNRSNDDDDDDDGGDNDNDDAGIIDDAKLDGDIDEDEAPMVNWCGSRSRSFVSR